jgi:hypothetical protein
MYIVAIAWGYVVLMMSITEESIVAGVMTFVLYGILPLTIILYIMGTPQRRRNRAAAAEQARLSKAAAAADSAADSDSTGDSTNVATAATPDALPRSASAPGPVDPASPARASNVTTSAPRDPDV